MKKVPDYSWIDSYFSKKMVWSFEENLSWEIWNRTQGKNLRENNFVGTWALDSSWWLDSFPKILKYLVKIYSTSCHFIGFEQMEVWSRFSHKFFFIFKNYFYVNDWKDICIVLDHNENLFEFEWGIFYYFQEFYWKWGFVVLPS